MSGIACEVQGYGTTNLYTLLPCQPHPQFEDSLAFAITFVGSELCASTKGIPNSCDSPVRNHGGLRYPPLPPEVNVQSEAGRVEAEDHRKGHYHQNSTNRV